MKIPIASILCDTALQMRVKRDLSLITEYADAIEDGTVLPPITVFAELIEPCDGLQSDDSPMPTKLWLGDGWHRIEAHVTLGLTTIEAELRPGGRRAAFLFALGANENHGLRRTSADKRKAVEAALDDLELRQLSDREIARLCGVGKNLVASVRGSRPDLALLDTKRRGRDGKVQSARKKGQVVERPPEPPLRKDGPMARLGAMKTTVRETFEAMPEDKRHLLCVELYNFICQNDPEVDAMNRTARQVGNPTVHKLLTTIEEGK